MNRRVCLGIAPDQLVVDVNVVLVAVVALTVVASGTASSRPGLKPCPSRRSGLSRDVVAADQLVRPFGGCP